MAHTPGPWTSAIGYVTDQSGVEIADVRWAGDDQEGSANADLIAAAPELLAALKAHIPWKLAGQPDEPPQGWGIWQDAIDAINKAEGRAT